MTATRPERTGIELKRQTQAQTCTQTRTASDIVIPRSQRPVVATPLPLQKKFTSYRMPPTSFLRWCTNAQGRKEQRSDLVTRSKWFLTLVTDLPFLHATTCLDGARRRQEAINLKSAVFLPSTQLSCLIRFFYRTVVHGEAGDQYLWGRRPLLIRLLCQKGAHGVCSAQIRGLFDIRCLTNPLAATSTLPPTCICSWTT